MTAQDFGELAGRIEGIARSVMILAGALQRQGVLDEQKLQASLRIHAEGLQPTVTNHATVVRTLNELADMLLTDHQQLKARERSGSR